MNAKRVSVYFPGDVRTEVAERAKTQGRSFSNMVIALLRRAMNAGYVYPTDPDCPDTDNEKED